MIGVAPVIASRLRPSPIRPIAARSASLSPPGRSKTTTAGTSSAAWPLPFSPPVSSASIARVDSESAGRKLACPAAVTPPIRWWPK